MRVGYILALCLFIIFNIFAGARAYRSKQKSNAQILAKLLFTVCIPLSANVILVLARNELVARFGYVVFFLGTDWMLLCLLRFVKEYCNYAYLGTRMRIAAIALMSADTVSIILNPFADHVFGVQATTLRDGSVYYAVASHWYHYVHLALNFGLVFLIFFYVIRKILQSSTVYLEKYLIPLMILALTSVWEAYSILRSSAFDTSMVGYGLCGVLFYYTVMHYHMYLLTDRMLSTVVANVTDGIFCFDNEGHCLFYNQSAKEMFELSPQDMRAAERTVEELMSVNERYTRDYVKETRHIQRNGEERIYEIEYHTVYDSRMIYTGFFINVEDHTDEQRRIEEETYRATHDELTGIYNRQELYRLTEQTIRRNPETRYVIVVSDIREFKMVNDVFGRETGDEILIRIAKAVQEFVRETDVFGRIGNDKFGLIMKKQDFNEEIFLEGTRLISYVGDEHSYPLVVHIGVYEVTNSRLSASAMYDRAFMALSSVKNELQVRLAYYDEKLRDDILWEQKIIGTLDDALEHGDIVPYLQAQVNRDGQIEGSEALVRWNHATEGFLTPGRFMPILERNGMVVKIDTYIWEYACKTLRRWKEEGRKEMYISVNISPKDFYFIDVYEVITGLVKKYEVDPSLLRLEITESTMMRDMERKMETINQLRKEGFLLEMDDFGSGYSSLNMLKDMPVDILKVDMLFLSKTDNIQRTRAILELIINLAKSLDMPVITEGVEEKQQVDTLTEMGCDMFQGYYFAKPISLREFEERFMDRGTA